MVKIVFDYRCFQNLEMTKLTHSFFCYWLKKQLEVDNVKIRKGNSQEKYNHAIVFQSREEEWEKNYWNIVSAWIKMSIPKEKLL